MTSALFFLTLAAYSLFFMLGCATSDKPLQRIATIELHDASPIMLTRDRHDSLMVFATIPSVPNGSAFRQVILYVNDPGGMRDSLTMQTVSSGVPGSATSTFARCRIPESMVSAVSQAQLLIGFERGSIVRIHPAQFISRDTSALSLTPFVRPGDEPSVVIGVNATRNRVIEGEYLPSSEDLRVIIRSGFKTIWQSNEGMAFLTVITPVRPESLGEVSTYSLDWDGTDTQGQALLPGEYTADIIIPSRPAPYQTQITFTWPLKKN